jgi:calcium-dependent protein kinase
MDITHRDLKYENIVSNKRKTYVQAGFWIKQVWFRFTHTNTKIYLHPPTHPYPSIIPQMFASPKPNADVKIIDFGLSKKYATSDGEMMHDAVGTVYSMSPEVLTGDYTNKVDVWSVGVLAFMLLSSSMPFYGNTRKDVIRKLLKGKFAFKARTWKFVTASAKQFCTELLEYNPDVRPTAEQALHLPWLDTVKHRTRTMSVDFAQHRDWVQVSLESFCQYTILKKLALMVVAHKSTDEEIGFLRRMFHQFDQTNDGDISYSEFASAMEEYGYTENECEALFKGVDLDNSGVVNYSEFVAATIEAHGTLSEERLAEAFDRIDADDSGFITVGDLRELLGGSVPNSYLNQIIDEADGVGEGHDHKIDYSEFLALWGAENDDRRAALLEDVVRRREEQQRKTIGYDDQNLESSVGDDLVSDMSIDTEDEEMSAVGDNMFQSHKEVSIRGHSELYGPRPVRPDVSGMYASRKKVHIIGSPAAIRNEIKYADI